MRGDEAVQLGRAFEILHRLGQMIGRLLLRTMKRTNGMTIHHDPEGRLLMRGDEAVQLGRALEILHRLSQMIGRLLLQSGEVPTDQAP